MNKMIINDQKPLMENEKLADIKGYAGFQGRFQKTLL